MINDNSSSTPSPLFSKGDSVYIVDLDRLKSGVITYAYLCGENTYYGYWLDFDNGGHDTIWDRDIGTRAFFTFEDAHVMQQKNAENILKINPNALSLKEHKSFQYTRDHDNYVMTANIAKIGENQIVYKDYYTYTFLDIFSGKKQRDKEYKKLFKTMEQQGEPISPLDFEKLYFCNKTRFSSMDYAMNNGHPYKDQGIKSRMEQVLSDARQKSDQHNSTKANSHQMLDEMLDRD